MATLEKVKPGDLITSELINAIIDAVQNLEACCEELQGDEDEGGGGRPPVTEIPVQPIRDMWIRKIKPDIITLNTPQFDIEGSGFGGTTDPLPDIQLMLNGAGHSVAERFGTPNVMLSHWEMRRISDTRLRFKLKREGWEEMGIEPKTAETVEGRPTPVTLPITIQLGTGATATKVPLPLQLTRRSR